MTVVLLDRETAVLRLIADGLRNPAIAAELGVSLSVVQRHYRSLTAKLRTTDRAGLVGAGYRTGALMPPADPGPAPDGFDEELHGLLASMARGMTNREIANSLGTVASAVAWRSRRLFEVLGVHDRANAVHVGISCGVLRLVPRERVSP